MEGGTGDLGVDVLSTTINNNIKITATEDWETACKVVFFADTPGNVGGNIQFFATKGSIVVLRGVNKGHSVTVRPIFDSNGEVELDVSKSVVHNFPLGGPPPLRDYLIPHLDSQIVRLSDGRLLANKPCACFKPVDNPQTWQEILIYTRMDPSNPKKALRGSQAFWISLDGTNWKIQGMADPFVFGDGKYGYPVPMNCDHDTVKSISDQCQDTAHPEYKWGGAGWDRQELYACPFTGYLYLTGDFAGGPYKDQTVAQTKSYRNVFLLCSQDKGKTWNVLKDDLPSRPPVVMTSTPNGRLFLCMWTKAGGARVYFSNLFTPPGLPAISEGMNITPEVWGVNAGNWWDSGINYLKQIFQPSISRISSDTTTNSVRVSHVLLNEHGRQAIKILNLDLNPKPSDVLPDGQITVSVAATLQPEHPETHSMTLGTFVDPDYVNFPPSFKSNTAMLYWLEYPADGSGATEGVCARYAMFQEKKLVEIPGFLSVQNGQPRFWNSRKTVGDYLTGGFFILKGKMNYVAQWPEPDGLKANIVTVKS
jgi:hypothetical protein